MVGKLGGGFYRSTFQNRAKLAAEFKAEGKSSVNF
jgi:hypothetical protein